MATSNTPDTLEARREERQGGIRWPRWRDYTAFVLSGGGARGALQVGALRALLEHGERADLVVGTSAGAWNGGMFAYSPTLDGIERLAAAWRTMNPATVLLGREPPSNRPAQAQAGLLLFAAARRVTSGAPSLYSDAGLRALIEHHLGGSPDFEDLALPLHVIATDITHARRVVFNSGPMVPAVLASSAIPGIFPPVQLGDATYVDGGALDNCSLDTALRLGARRLFVLDVGYDGSAELDIPSHESTPRGLRLPRSAPRAGASYSLAAVLERTSQAMSRYHLDRALERVPRGVELHVLRLSTRTGGGALGFGNAREWIEQGYDQTSAYLRQELPGVPAAPHEATEATTEATRAAMADAGEGTRVPADQLVADQLVASNG